MSYKDALGKNAVLKRVTGLKNVRFKSRPSKFKTTAESYRRKDQISDGEFLEDFKDNVIPGANTYLAPYWNDLHDTYWVEDLGLLHRIIKESGIKVRYSEGHEKEGKLIDIEDIDPTNYWDSFFQSQELRSKTMSGGTYNFNLHKDPIDVILYYCYKNDPRVLVRDGREISKYVVGQAQYELLIPKYENQQTKNVLEDEINALTTLGSLTYDKKKIISHIMRLRVNDRNNPDPDQLLLELGRVAKSNKNIASLGMSEQKRFLNLATMSSEDLMLSLDIVKALEMRIITSSRNEYFLNQEVMQGVKDEIDIFHFLKLEENIEKYKDLIFLIEEKEKQVV